MKGCTLNNFFFRYQYTYTYLPNLSLVIYINLYGLHFVVLLLAYFLNLSHCGFEGAIKLFVLTINYDKIYTYIYTIYIYISRRYFFFRVFDMKLLWARENKVWSLSQRYVSVCEKDGKSSCLVREKDRAMISTLMTSVSAT